MSKFEFASSDELGREVIMRFDEIQLTEVIMRFEEFLRGNGFYFQGQLQIVENEVNDEAPDDETDHH